MTRNSEGVTLALVALLAMLSVAVVVDSAPSEPPVLAFRPTGDRSLIAVNNPEQLWPSDFADPYYLFPLSASLSLFINYLLSLLIIYSFY
jgi:hypothetical protein